MSDPTASDPTASDPTQTNPVRPRLVHDRLTWSLYCFPATWGFFLYGFSPIVPLIAKEQGITRGEAGLHGTAMALASITVGLTLARLVRRWGRRNVLIGAALTLAAGTGLLMVGHTLALTLPAVYLAALGGGSATAAMQTTLAVHHRAAAPAAITQANGVGTALGLFAPLAVGWAVGAHWGWRPAVAFTIVLAAVAVCAVATLPPMAALSGKATIDPATLVGHDAATRAVERFPARYWCFWAGVLAGGAIESATTYWAADVIHATTGEPVAASTAAIAALIGAMCLSRFIFGPISLRKAPEKLLLVSYVLAAVGWLVLWTADTLVWATAGLAIAGLGYGAHYPLAVALALRAAPSRPDKAQAVVSLGGGMMAGITPTALGMLSDQVGPHQAFLAVPVFVAIAAGAIGLGLYFVRRDLRSGRTLLPARVSE